MKATVWSTVAMSGLFLAGCNSGQVDPAPATNEPAASEPDTASDSKARDIGREVGETSREISREAKELGQEVTEKAKEFGRGVQEGFEAGDEPK